MRIIILKVWYNQSINNIKCAFDDLINKDDYLCQKNFRLAVYQKLKVSKYGTRKIYLKGWLTLSIDNQKCRNYSIYLRRQYGIT